MRVAWLLTQETFDFYFFPSYAVRLVPMDFGAADDTTRKANSGNSFKLPPTSRTVILAQSRQITNGTCDGNRFNLGDRSDDFKVHAAILRLAPRRVKQAATEKVMPCPT